MTKTEAGIGICCYSSRALAFRRCAHCKPEFGCPTFKTMAEVIRFNALIPATMLDSPLPLDLWPTMCRDVMPQATLQTTARPISASEESPLRLLAATLGLPLDADPIHAGILSHGVNS